MLSEDWREQVEGLFRRHGKGVGSYLLARVGDADVAETIAACVFLTVVRRIEQCRSSPVAWLWSIVRSELARYFRDRRAVEPLDTEPPDGSRSGDPTARAERREAETRLQQALTRLNDEQQTLVYMKFFLELPNVEIAEALGMTPSNVGVVAHRAVKKLRELMEEPARGGRRRTVPAPLAVAAT